MTTFDWVVVVGISVSTVILLLDQTIHGHPTGYLVCSLCAKMIITWLIVLGVLAGIGFIAEGVS